MIFTNNFNCHDLEKAPELLNWVLFAGEEQAQQSFSLDAHDQTSSQDSEQSHQDAHCQTPAVCSETHTETIDGLRDKSLLVSYNKSPI